MRGGSLDTDERAAKSLKAAIVGTLAVTLLNPHFYLDTVVLLGGVSSQFHGDDRLSFWAGAVSALDNMVFLPESWRSNACPLV